MGPVENMNRELGGLMRYFRIYLREKAKLEITTESPLLVGQTLWMDLEPLRRRQNRILQAQGTRIHSWHTDIRRRFATSCPRPLISRSSTTAGALRSGWDKSDPGDTIIGSTCTISSAESRGQALERKGAEDGHMHTPGTPWPGEVVVRRRYITRASTERYGPADDCSKCLRKSQRYADRCRARFELLCAGESGPVEVRAPEGQPAPPDPAGTEPCFSINGSPGRQRQP